MYKERIICGRWYVGNSSEDRYVLNLVDCMHHGEEVWYLENDKKKWAKLRDFREWAEELI